MPIDEDSEFIVGPPGASSIFYAWFIIGVLGLGLSVYGLNAAEAGMLVGRTSDGSVPKALLARDKYVSGTWSGPGGWAKTANRLRRPDAEYTLPWRLWLTLAIPSFLVFIALPLSGLSLETDSGYVRRLSGSGKGVDVRGFFYANFNERLDGEVVTDTETLWKSTAVPNIPKMGIIYTRPGAKPMARGSLPTDEGVSDIFLTAQADTPIEGTAWGLSVTYDCSIADSLSDFTLLKRTTDDLDWFTRPILANPDEGIAVTMANSTEMPRRNSMFGVIEHGHKMWPTVPMMNQISEAGLPGPETYGGCYFNSHEDITGDYHDADQESIFEMVYWQLIIPSRVEFTEDPGYNLTIGHNMTDLYGAYSVKERGNLFDLIQEGGDADKKMYPMHAIGVRCSSSASVGTARIDGTTATFTDFVRTDTPFSASRGQCAPRLNSNTLGSLFTMTMPPLSSINWLLNLMNGHVPPQQSLETVDGRGERVRLSYLQPEHLRKSVLRMYSSVVLHTMYGNVNGFVSSESARGSVNPNVTGFEPGTVLKPGPIPPEVSVALFLVWTLMTTVLCVLYGFRPRWSDTVDEGVRSFR